MKKVKFKLAMLLLSAVSVSCEIVDNDLDKNAKDSEDVSEIQLKDVASVLVDVPLQNSHLVEVYEAVKSSTENGYDEEYTLKNLFENPGAGVGGTATKAKLETPLKDLIAQHLKEGGLTKVTGAMDPETFMQILTSSDIQIYWPYSDRWDGKTLPIITFDPENGEESNVGYELLENEDGSRSVRELTVDEEMAKQRPVWVVNRNSDAGFTPLTVVSDSSAPRTKGDFSGRSLILKEILANRNYDNWFAGASEFFVLTITGGCSFA